MKKLLLSGIAALLLATGTAHADPLPNIYLGRWCLGNKNWADRGSIYGAVDTEKNGRHVKPVTAIWKSNAPVLNVKTVSRKWGECGLLQVWRLDECENGSGALNRWHRMKNYSAIQWSVPSQPRNHREIDRVAPRDRCQGFACSTPLDGLSPLIGRELGLAAKFDAIRHRPPAALAGALPDQLALKLRDGGQERGEQPTLRA